MDKYTTADLLAKDGIGEKNKTILSNDAYALVESLTKLWEQSFDKTK